MDVEILVVHPFVAVRKRILRKRLVVGKKLVNHKTIASGCIGRLSELHVKFIDKIPVFKYQRHVICVFRVGNVFETVIASAKK